MPRPFARPSLSLSIGEIKRVWNMVPANKLRPGDTIPEIGLVREVFEVEAVSPSGAVFSRIVVKGGNDNQKIYEYTQMVKAFVVA